MNESNMTMFEWMCGAWIDPVVDALGYYIGQDINHYQAKEMIRLIAKSAGHDIEKPGYEADVWNEKSPYRNFIFGCLYLIVATDDVDDVSGWRRSIYDALSMRDRRLMDDVISHELGFSVLDIIYERKW